MKSLKIDYPPLVFKCQRENDSNTEWRMMMMVCLWCLWYSQWVVFRLPFVSSSSTCYSRNNYFHIPSSKEWHITYERLHYILFCFWHHILETAMGLQWPAASSNIAWTRQSLPFDCVVMTLRNDTWDVKRLTANKKFNTTKGSLLRIWARQQLRTRFLSLFSFEVESFSLLCLTLVSLCPFLSVFLSHKRSLSESMSILVFNFVSKTHAVASHAMTSWPSMSFIPLLSF